VPGPGAALGGGGGLGNFPSFLLISNSVTKKKYIL